MLEVERMPTPIFEWDFVKDVINQEKHGVSFAEATKAFEDPYRLIVKDKKHSSSREHRYFCIGKVAQGILTVRFTKRDGKIRIFGAGFWRDGRERYEDEHA